MSDLKHQRTTVFNRRFFLERSSLAMAGATAIAGSTRLALAGAGKEANPFAYDVDRFAHTDPKLIRYEEAARFKCPAPEPNRIAIGPDNHIYIAAKNAVSIHDLAGGKLRDIVLPGPATCVASGSDGSIYVGLRAHVQVYDASGRPQSKSPVWETPGKSAWLTGLAVHGEDIFVADSGNRVVWRCNRSGKIQAKIGEKNKDREVPGLVLPSPYLDVAVAKDGLLRINNPGRHRVEVYTVEGDLEASWGRPGVAIQGFCGCCNPIAICPLPDGRCVTCEKGIPRVKVHSADGIFESVVAGPEAFPDNARAGSMLNKAGGRFGGMDAAVDSSGNIYIVDLVREHVLVMKPKA